METSDLSTSEAHSDVEPAGARARNSPARYSPPPQERRQQPSSKSVVPETPVPTPSCSRSEPETPPTPVSVPRELLMRSAEVMSRTKQQSPMRTSSCSHSEPSAPVQLGPAVSAGQTGRAASAGELVLVIFQSDRCSSFFAVIIHHYTKA